MTGVPDCTGHSHRVGYAAILVLALQLRDVPMKRIFVVLIAMALLSFGTASSAGADDVAVIVHKSNPVASLTMAELRIILLGPRPKWSSGYDAVVLMTQPGQPERSSTLRIVCGMSETTFNLHFIRGWRKPDGSTNSTVGDSPRVFSSGVQLRQSVARAPNAVGFINASQVDDSVKVVAVDGSSPGQAAYKLKLK
jgi:ABC-type phosphate transport system substrate-binding protein